MKNLILNSKKQRFDGDEESEVVPVPRIAEGVLRRGLLARHAQAVDKPADPRAARVAGPALVGPGAEDLAREVDK